MADISSITLYTPADDSWKPCPFCGGHVKIMSHEFYSHLMEHSENGTAALDLSCECGVEMNDFSYRDGINDYFDRMTNLRAKWNGRASA